MLQFARCATGRGSSFQPHIPPTATSPDHLIVPRRPSRRQSAPGFPPPDLPIPGAAARLTGFAKLRIHTGPSAALQPAAVIFGVATDRSAGRAVPGQATGACSSAPTVPAPADTRPGMVTDASTDQPPAWSALASVCTASSSRWPCRCSQRRPRRPVAGGNDHPFRLRTLPLYLVEQASRLCREYLPA